MPLAVIPSTTGSCQRLVEARVPPLAGPQADQVALLVLVLALAFVNFNSFKNHFSFSSFVQLLENRILQGFFYILYFLTIDSKNNNHVKLRSRKIPLL